MVPAFVMPECESPSPWHLSLYQKYPSANKPTSVISRDSEIIANSNNQSVAWMKQKQKSIQSRALLSCFFWHFVWRAIGFHCRYGFKKKAVLVLKPLSKTLTRLKWEKHITLTPTPVFKVSTFKSYTAYIHLPVSDFYCTAVCYVNAI